MAKRHEVISTYELDDEMTEEYKKKYKGPYIFEEIDERVGVGKT